MELIANNALFVAEDFFHAALILQHGSNTEDYLSAHELALKAVELGHPKDRKARWLTAASYDRWFTSQGKPQKYGTQYFREASGWTLMAYDPSTTDEERQQWGVPSLNDLLRHTQVLNEKYGITVEIESTGESKQPNRT